ncbi:HAMP domain-containing histidine kinase [bacterium]|nr:HAMP domain-containing histidine kinase [bacterium]
MNPSDDCLDRMKNFCAVLSHDLNNYAGIIQGYVELMRMDLNEDSECMGYLDRIVQACAKIMDKSRSFETFAQTRSLMLIPTDLAALVKEVIADAPVELTVESGCHTVAAHPDALRAAVGELVGNAREAAGESGIQMRIYDEGPNVCLDVVNPSHSEVGVIPHRAFDPYYTTRGKGRGMGLAKVHGIVGSHNAQIEMLSSTPDQTCLKMSFPVLQER